MNEPHDLNPTVDLPSTPADSLEAGLVAGFGKRVEAPRSSLGNSLRPVLLRDAEGESAHVVRPRSDAMPTAVEAGDRYQLSGEIARGGMGAVLRGRDVDLGRDLAVKVLLDKYSHRPEVARRFIEEAQIGGQLQHPGVVPVYDIGRFGDRPFFTMKLVKGQTLQALLGERADYTADRPRLLGIALKVAETLAYAHAKGVIHRDLKPANIMVGAFGEVQVMDWGLAKVLAEGGIADEERASRAYEQPKDITTIRTARSSDSTGSFGTETEAGSILGTPAYMPPEQASGDIAILDRRADVFGFGAILCEILTGKPPYVGRSGEEVRRKAANGDLTDATARLDACGADADLIVLTKQCLSPEAIDRPKDAQEVTDKLSTYLNGVQERLQTAERERAVAVVREAEQRKKRKVQLALAAALVVLMLGGGAFVFWQAEQAQASREREARNAEAVASLLGQTEEALKAGDAAKAAVVLEDAKKRSAEGGAEKNAERVKRLEANLALLRDLDEVDQFRWTWSENRFPDAAVVATRTREALKRFGADPDAISMDEAAARVSASVLHERIVSALDRLLLPIRLVDVDKLPLEKQKGYTPQLMSDIAAQFPKSVGVRDLLKRVDSDPYRDAVRDAVIAADRAKYVALAGDKVADKQPPLFAAFLGENKVISEGRRRQLLQAALSLRPGNVGLLMTLGDTYLGNKELADEQVRWFQAAVAAAPNNYAAHINLGTALADKSQLDEAIAYFQKAIELDPKHAIAHISMGNALGNKGQVVEAIACFQQAIALDPKLATAHNNLGVALRERGDMDGAMASFRKVIELDPKFAPAYGSMGAILSNIKKDHDGAIVHLRKAIELDPKEVKAHYNLGTTLVAKGQVDEGIVSFRKAIELDPKLATAHNSLGAALARKGQVDEGIVCFRTAVELDPKSAMVHNSLGAALAQKGQVDEAIVSFRKAIELDSKYAGAHANLGGALMTKGDLDGGIASFRKAIELDPKFAPARTGLARAERLAATQEQLSAFLKGDFKPTSNNERLVLAELCKFKKLYRAAVGLYTDAFAADPRLADDLRTTLRYKATCSAALGAAGQGEDVAKHDDTERTRLRKQALDWLKADLTEMRKLLDSGPPQARPFIVQVLSHWQKNADLAGFRDAAALAKLPADELKAFTQLWADVAALLKKAEEKGN